MEKKVKIKSDMALQWVRLLVPVVLALAGATGYNTYSAKGDSDIKKETETHVDYLFNEKLEQLKNRLDSLDRQRTVLLAKGLSSITSMTEEQSREYVETIIPWSIQKLREDSIWKSVEKPMLYEVYSHYSTIKSDCDLIRTVGKKLYYVDCDTSKTLRRLILGKVGSWSKEAWYYRNEKDEPIRISEQSEMSYWSSKR